MSLLRCHRNLKHLDLRNTAVSDYSVGSIVELEKLRRLNLTGTNVTESGLAQLSGRTHEYKQGLTLLLGLQRLVELGLPSRFLGDKAIAALPGTWAHSHGWTNQEPDSPLTELALKDFRDITNVAISHLSRLSDRLECLCMCTN